MHIVFLILLALTACARTPAPIIPAQVTKIVEPNPELAAAAFDRFEQLCLANIDTPQRAMADAKADLLTFPNGERREEATLGANGLLNCWVYYSPGPIIEATMLALEREKSWTASYGDTNCSVMDFVKCQIKLADGRKARVFVAFVSDDCIMILFNFSPDAKSVGS